MFWDARQLAAMRFPMEVLPVLMLNAFSRCYVSVLDAFAVVYSTRVDSTRHGLFPWGADIPPAHVHHEKFWSEETYAKRLNGFLHLRLANVGQAFHHR